MCIRDSMKEALRLAPEDERLGRFVARADAFHGGRCASAFDQAKYGFLSHVAGDVDFEGGVVYAASKPLVTPKECAKAVSYADDYCAKKGYWSVPERFRHVRTKELDVVHAPKLLTWFNKCLKHLIFPCLLYTSPSPRDATLSRMPSSA